MKPWQTMLLLSSSLFILTGCQTKETSTQQSDYKESADISMNDVNDKINDDKFYSAIDLLEQLEKQGNKEASDLIDQLHDYQESEDELRRGNFKDATRLVDDVMEETNSAALKDKAAQLKEDITEQEEDVQKEKEARDAKEERTSHDENSTSKQSVHEYSSTEKENISTDFLQWAIPRAQTAKMAVTDAYNIHGASGTEDVYINTPDGKVLIEGDGNSGDYVAEAVAGLLFCYTNNGETGNLTLGPSTASLFNNVALHRKANKYILASNGVVYEAKGTGSQLIGYGGLSQGTNYDGTTWIVSEDTAAQAEVSQLLS